MIFDSDLIIWILKGNEKGLRILKKNSVRYISTQSYMELLQGAKNKEQHKDVLKFLSVLNFIILPLSEKIGSRASIYVEEYSLSNNMEAGDAIIAATAIENNMILCSGNKKHFKVVKELQFKHFKP